MKKTKKSRKESAAEAEAPVAVGEDTPVESLEMAESATQSVDATPSEHEAPASSEPPQEVLDLRSQDREAVELKTIVQVKEQDDLWKETAIVHSISRAGAGFNLSRACGVGRLVTMVLPLPVSMRAYDFHERLYPVMGLVQYCHEITMDGVKTYNVGVAFIGKRIPESYATDPCQNYRLTGMGENGLWRITEAANDFHVRKHSRFWVEVEVALTILQRDKKAVCKDVTKTQDISKGGASLRSSVVAKIGDKVKFTCKDYNFFSMAVVRGRSSEGGEQPMIHLEFLDAQFPVHRLPKVTSEPERTSEGPAAAPVMSAAKATGFAIERF